MIMKHMFQCIMTMKFYRVGSELTDRWNFSVTYTRLRNCHLILSTVILATLPNLTQLASTLHHIKWVEFFRCTQLCWLLVVNACVNACFFLFYSHHYIVTICPHRLWNTACQCVSILFLAIDQIPRVSLCGQSVWSWNQQTDKKHKIHLIWNIILCADRHQHSNRHRQWCHWTDAHMW